MYLQGLGEQDDVMGGEVIAEVTVQDISCHLHSNHPPGKPSSYIRFDLGFQNIYQIYTHTLLTYSTVPTKILHQILSYILYTYVTT